MSTPVEALSARQNDAEIKVNKNTYILAAEQRREIIDRVDAEPLSPAVRDFYIIGDTPTGTNASWTGNANKLALWNGSDWWVWDPARNQEFYKSDGSGFQWNGTSFDAIAGGVPSHASTHENGGSDEIDVTDLSGELADAQLSDVGKNGTPVSTRPEINLIEGSNITITVADDPGNDRANVTIDAAGGGSGTPTTVTANFDTDITATDPGAMDVKFDNATLASVTNIYISDTLVNGLDAGSIVSALQTNDRIYMQQVDTQAKSVIFSVSGAATDNTGWWTIPVTVLSSNTIMDSAAETALLFMFSSSPGAGTSWNTTKVTGAGTAASNDEVFASTTGGGYTYNLPSSPSNGDRVRFLDIDETWDTDNLIIGRNGSTIKGLATDYTANTPDAWLEFVYNGTDGTWEVYHQ